VLAFGKVFLHIGWHVLFPKTYQSLTELFGNPKAFHR
jgi:hypothetical protein